MIGHIGTSGPNPALKPSERAISRMPTITGLRTSMPRAIKRPTIVIDTSVPTPRGASSNPVVTTG